MIQMMGGGIERRRVIGAVTMVSFAAIILAGCSQSVPADPVEETSAAPSVASSAVPDAISEPPASGSDGFAPAREAIVSFCRGDAACAQEQKEELAYFVKMMAAFEDREGAVAQRCMRSGLVDGGIDWTVATPCLRAAAKGKPIGASIN